MPQSRNKVKFPWNSETINTYLQDKIHIIKTISNYKVKQKYKCKHESGI